jgi:predicted ATPase/class 3 adenylate cyclase
MAALPERQQAAVDGYQIGPLLHAGAHCLVFRGIASATSRSVVIKISRDPYPSDRDLAAQRRAYDIAREIRCDAVVAHLALAQAGYRQALITEDFNAVSLDRYHREHPRLAQREVLALGVALARSLAKLHRAGVIHLRIQPSNILWSPTRRLLKLTDLQHCSRLQQEAVQARDQVRLPAMPVYVAPEQTGRMNRSVDARADLYAAGVVLYELLTGSPPFTSTDPSELIHAHLARQPAAPSTRETDLHPSVPEILLRLLQKDPDARYASADGLASDLERCLNEVAAGTAARFALGLRDLSERFVLPDRLYGRQTETEALRDAVEACTTGQRQCLLVAGYSGIGKSALIGEVQLPVAARRGWFCPGKFDQFRRDRPYLAWRQALASLTRQALAKPEAELVALRGALDQALAGNGALIAELVPGVDALLGEQGALPAVGPAEAQARFEQALRTFLRVLAQDEHPLVLFLDDLQWADLASLALLESLLSDPTPAHLLILGAYRDNEVGPGHPLTASLGRLAERGTRPRILSLPPLAPEHVAALVSDSLRLGLEAAAPLAALVHAKTGGNPFFVRQFMQQLVAEGLLRLDPDVGQWRWDQHAIERQGYTDNVVELMSRRIRDLSADTLRMLQLGACLGATFDLQRVVRVCDQSAIRIAAHLEQALTTGLLLPLDSDYKLALTNARLAERAGSAPSLNPRYAFLHDRVQQTVHDSIEPADRAMIHVRIARTLLADASSASLPQRALELMDHLAEAQSLITDADERLRFARLCLIAGQRAKASMATVPAVDFLALGRQLLSADAWSTEPDLALDLHLEAADACYICERYPEAEELAQAVLARTRDLHRRVAAHNVLIGIGVAQRRYVEATMLGLGVLEQELDLRLPRRAGMPRVLLGILRTRTALRGRSPGAMLALPAMHDPRAQASIAILMKCATNAYWGAPTLVPLIAGRMVRLSLETGNAALSAYGYALFGMIITNAVGAVDAGYRLGKLAMDLIERTGARHLIGKTGLLWHGFIRHAKDPLRLCAADTLGCYDHALDAGDVENAVYCGTVAYYTDLLAGRPLDWMDQRYRDYLPALLASSQAHTVLVLRAWMQVVANLADGERVESKAVGELVDWPARLTELLVEPDGAMSIATVAGGAGWLAFLLDDWAEAERQLALLYERSDAALGQSFWRTCMALYGITLSRKLGRGDGGASVHLRLARIRRWVDVWAGHNRHDYEPYRLILAAEAATGRQRHALALGAWHDAAARSRDNGNLFLEAWCSEQAAHAHGCAGHRAQAHDVRMRAQRLWQRYGAGARLRLMGGQGSARSALTEGAPLDGIALDALLGSVRAVSESIQVDALVGRVLEVLLVQSGARRATLLIQEQGLRPLAAAVIDEQQGLQRLPEPPPKEPGHLPVSLLDYVARTRRMINVDNAVTHEWLCRDPYTGHFDCLSLLGAPLLRHGRLVGMVLLENELAAGVFSDADANLVEAIAGQAAVSLENARLFEAQQRQSEAFARFLPRPFLEHLGHRQVEDIRLGEGIQRQVTVMFTDLRGFTTLCERLSAHDTFALVNSILARMAPVLSAEGGFIDEFTGDGVKALFIDRADGAVRAAIAMQQQLGQYSAERIAQGREPLAMGIGVHTGSVMLGTIGAEGRMSTTVLGDTVNTTARLEGLTKVYDTPVLISEATRAELNDPLAYCLRAVGRIRFKGRQQALLVHEVVAGRKGAERDALTPMVPMFNAALTAWLERCFDEAESGFARCLALAPDDRLSSAYLEWTRRCLSEGIPDDWDGVIVRAEK